MTAEVKIVTDSTAYLSSEEIAKYNVHVVPLKVIFGADDYSEGEDITSEEFYRRLASSRTLPTTSQPSINDFTQIYSELAQGGHPILSIHISSKLSGAVNSARAAKVELPQAQIEVVDSLSIAMRMLVGPAAEAAKKGQSLSQIKDSIERLNASISALGVLDTLEYLWRGGRIGGAKALLGTMLRIKPILAFEGGELKVLAKERTTRKAIQHILGLMKERMKGSALIHVIVVHTHSLKPVLVLKEEVQAHFNCAELALIELGPVLGTHIGPGFFGLGFYSERDWQPTQ